MLDVRGGSPTSMKEPSVASDSRLGSNKPAASSIAVGESSSERIEIRAQG